MTKSQLIEAIFEKADGLTKNQVAVIIETVFDGMKEALSKGDKVEIRGFGSFKVKEGKAREGRNPKTGQKVEVPAKKRLHFKIGEPFHDALNPKQDVS